MTRPGIETRSHGPLANTPPTRPMSRFKNAFNSLAKANIRILKESQIITFISLLRIKTYLFKKWLIEKMNSQFLNNTADFSFRSRRELSNDRNSSGGRQHIGKKPSLMSIIFSFFLWRGVPAVIYYHIYQPLHSGRIWHKVNFLSGF